MPVEFLNDVHLERYGRFQGDPTPLQLAEYFLLTPRDLVVIADLKFDHTRLGFALQLRKIFGGTRGAVGCIRVRGQLHRGLEHPLYTSSAPLARGDGRRHARGRRSKALPFEAQTHQHAAWPRRCRSGQDVRALPLRAGRPCQGRSFATFT